MEHPAHWKTVWMYLENNNENENEKKASCGSPHSRKVSTGSPTAAVQGTKSHGPYFQHLNFHSSTVIHWQRRIRSGWSTALGLRCWPAYADRYPVHGTVDECNEDECGSARLGVVGDGGNQQCSLFWFLSLFHVNILFDWIRKVLYSTKKRERESNVLKLGMSWCWI